MKGILFTAAMHKAIRDKLKTQTRRLHQLKEINRTPDAWWLVASFDDGALIRFANDELDKDLIVKPRYRIGEVVYIKEAYAPFLRLDFISDKTGFRVQYKLDNAVEDKYCTTEQAKKLKTKRGIVWDSPMFMPAWAARDFIKITDVRPERLQDINTEDCKAEGLSSEPYEDWKVADILKFWQGRFEELWNSINGKAYPFAGNFWVWRYEFKLGVK